MPLADWIGRSRMDSIRSTRASSTRTRRLTTRSPWSTEEAVTPRMAVLTARAISSASRPKRRASAGRTLRRIDGPATTRPSLRSTTPCTFSTTSATWGACRFRKARSLEKILISIGSGDHVRSPMRSARMPGNSHSMWGSAAWSSLRRLPITSFVACLRSGLSLTRKSPVFGSWTWKPRAAPVRRE